MYSIMPCAAQLRERERRLACRARQALIDGRGDVVEALRAAGAELKMPETLAVVEEMQVDLDHVLDRDEIAPLLAVAVAAASPRTASPCPRRGTG